MKDEIKNKIEKIISESECSKNFKCLENRVESSCKVIDIGMENTLLFLESQELVQCEHVTELDKSYFCQCPVRVCIAQEMKFA